MPPTRSAPPPPSPTTSPAIENEKFAGPKLDTAHLLWGGGWNPAKRTTPAARPRPTRRVADTARGRVHAHGGPAILAGDFADDVAHAFAPTTAIDLRGSTVGRCGTDRRVRGGTPLRRCWSALHGRGDGRRQRYACAVGGLVESPDIAPTDCGAGALIRISLVTAVCSSTAAAIAGAGHRRCRRRFGMSSQGQALRSQAACCASSSPIGDRTRGLGVASEPVLHLTFATTPGLSGFRAWAASIAALSE
jgi:hypothetical protein